MTEEIKTKYFIVWTHKQNSKIAGKGDAKLDYQTAKLWAEFANKEYPELSHDVLPHLEEKEEK